MEFLKMNYSYDSYKYRVLACLLLNHYNRKYKNIKKKILIIPNNECDMMKDYEIFYKTIETYEVRDIITLKKFKDERDRKLKEIFKYYDDNKISYKDTLNDIKRIYNPNAGDKYINAGYEKAYMKKDLNVIFIAEQNMLDIYDKYNVGEILYLAPLRINYLKNNDYNTFIGNLAEYVEEYKKVYNIVKDINKNNLYYKNTLYFTVFTENNFEVADTILNEVNLMLKRIEVV